MLRLKTDCNKCLHRNVCKNKDNAKAAMNKLKDTNYGKGPNDDYGWDIMSDVLHINIEFSCPDYEGEKKQKGSKKTRYEMRITQSPRF